MKVLHLSCVAPPQTGGIGQAAAKEVSLLRDLGIETTLAAPAFKDVPAEDGVRRVKAFWEYGNTAFLDWPELQGLVKDVDVVHLHYPFYGVDMELALLKQLGRVKRLVLTFHMDATASDWHGLVFDLHRAFPQKLVLRAADAVIVSSKDYAAASSIARLLDEPEWKGRIHELPFGVDAERFSPGPARRKEYGIPEASRVLVFVGGMDRAHSFKGIPVLLKALTHLDPRVMCILAGDGDLRSAYEAMAKTLGVESRVRFLGRVSDERLPDVYRLGEVFVFPSTSSAEAFGLVALEAQACGIPVVASNLPGVRTVVKDGETGFLTTVFDDTALAKNIEALLADEAKRAAFGKSAREHVLARFTWRAHAEGLKRIYANLS